MKRNIGISLCMTVGMLAYELVAHGDQQFDWFKPVFHFCFILVALILFNKRR